MLRNTLNTPPAGTITKQTPYSPMKNGRVRIMLNTDGTPVLDTEGNAVLSI